jgi:hypothetical protein
MKKNVILPECGNASVTPAKDGRAGTPLPAAERMGMRPAAILFHSGIDLAPGDDFTIGIYE